MTSYYRTQTDLSAELLSELREHLYLSSQYYYDDSDDAGETDNVQWISGHRTVEFVKSEVWGVVRETLTQITGVITVCLICN